MTIRAAWEQERAQLMPMPTPFDGYVELPARVSSTSLVTVARNRYSMPCAWAEHRVSVRLYPERVVIVADAGVVADHARAVDRDHVVYHWQHSLPLVERKPGALRNRRLSALVNFQRAVLVSLRRASTDIAKLRLLLERLRSDLKETNVRVLQLE